MDEMSVVIMLKDKDTGFLEKELGSYKITENENLIVNIYAEETADSCLCHMKVSTDYEPEDWEFEAIYDYYDNEIFGGEVLSLLEVEDCFNPTWEMVFDFCDDIYVMESKISRLLKIHENELKSVYSLIADKKDEYEEK